MYYGTKFNYNNHAEALAEDLNGYDGFQSTYEVISEESDEKEFYGFN